MTEDGVLLLKACNELCILFDVSHITENGFFDIATHSNAHAMKPTNEYTRHLLESSLGYKRKSLEKTP